MKKLTIALVLLLMTFSISAQDVNLRYYIPGDQRYNTNIPTPKKVIGHEVGEWHVSHDKLVQYMRAFGSFFGSNFD